MLRNSSGRFLVICSFIALMLSGCGNVHKTAGSIKGQVVNAQGKGVAGVTVSMQNLSITAQTDGSGWYKFDNIPEGTYTVVAGKSALAGAQLKSAADIAGYTLEEVNGNLVIKQSGAVVPFRETLAQLSTVSQAGVTGSVQVSVKRGVTVAAAPIALLPTTANLNNVVIYQADPAPATTTLQAEKANFVQFDIAYNARASGVTLITYVCAYQSGSCKVIKDWSFAVSGNGSLVVGGNITIPSTNSVEVVAALVDSSKKTMAVASLPTYAVGGGSVVLAPFLSVGNASIAGVELKWRGGNTTGFTEYQIKRDNHTIATIKDSSVTSYIDKGPVQVKGSTYEITVITNSGYAGSNTVSVYVPNTGVKQYTIPNVRLGSPLTDATNGYLYTTGGRNEVRKYNLSGVLQGAVSVCSAPGGITKSSDNTLLAVICASADSVAFIDMDTFKLLRVVHGIPYPKTMAIDAANQKAYIGTYEKGIYVVDISNGQVTHPNEPVYTNMNNFVLSRDKSKLIMSSVSGVIALTTTDFTLLHQYSVPSSFHNIIVDPIRNLVYMSNVAYDSESSLRKADLPFSTYTISPDGNTLMGKDSGGLSIAKYQNGAFVITDYVSLEANQYVFTADFSEDGSKILVAQDPPYYASSNTIYLYTIDLEKRALYKNQQGVL